MSKIPTIKKFLKSKGCINAGKSWAFVTEDNIIEFARLHLEAQTKTIVNKIKLRPYRVRLVDCVEIKDKILNAYPLDNIK